MATEENSICSCTAACDAIMYEGLYIIYMYIYIYIYIFIYRERRESEKEER